LTQPAESRHYLDQETKMLLADAARIEWNADKKRWEVHILVGEEVIKRPISEKHMADSGEAELKREALAIVHDEGYEVDPQKIAIEESANHFS